MVALIGRMVELEEEYRPAELEVMRNLQDTLAECVGIGTQEQHPPEAEPGPSGQIKGKDDDEFSQAEESFSTDPIDEDNTVDVLDHSAQALGETHIARKLPRRSRWYRRSKLRKIRVTTMSKVTSIDPEIATRTEDSE